MFNLLKRIINNFKNDCFKKRKVSSLKFGDVVWCEIFKTKKYEFKKGHEIRPFTILFVKGKYMYGFTHTHKVLQKEIVLYKEKGTLLTGEIIKLKYTAFKNYSKRKYSKEELEYVSKAIYAKIPESYLRNKVEPLIPLSLGDVIKINKNKNALVKKVDGEKVECYIFSFKRNFQNDQRYFVNGKEYFLSNSSVIYKRNKVIYLRSISNKLLYSFDILFSKDALKLNQKEKFNISIGDIVIVRFEKFIVKKFFEKEQASLIKITSKSNAQFCFKYDGEKYYVLKDLVVFPVSSLKLIKHTNSKIIDEFIKAKKRYNKVHISF